MEVVDEDMMLRVYDSDDDKWLSRNRFVCFESDALVYYKHVTAARMWDVRVEWVGWRERIESMRARYAAGEVIAGVPNTDTMEYESDVIKVHRGWDEDFSLVSAFYPAVG